MFFTKTVRFFGFDLEDVICACFHGHICNQQVKIHTKFQSDQRYLAFGSIPQIPPKIWATLQISAKLCMNHQWILIHLSGNFWFARSSFQKSWCDEVNYSKNSDSHTIRNTSPISVKFITKWPRTYLQLRKIIWLDSRNLARLGKRKL